MLVYNPIDRISSNLSAPARVWNDPVTGETWNLLEMLNLSVRSWIEIGEAFRDLKDPLSVVTKSGLEENREDIVRPLQRIAAACAEIHLRFSESYAVGLVEHYSNKPTFTEDMEQQMASLLESLSGKPLPPKKKTVREEMEELYHPPKHPSAILREQIQTLQERIEDELTGRRFFGIDPGESSLYLRSEWIGASVLNKFYGVSWEAEEAGTCFALGRDTACVFHLMRVLEYGLASLAHALNVPIVNPNWHQILVACEKQITLRNGNDPNWKRDEQFFHAVAMEFRHFQLALRNHTAHAKERYSHDCGFSPKAITVLL